jgi:predicted nucleic acid-binding protein
LICSAASSLPGSFPARPPSARPLPAQSEGTPPGKERYSAVAIKQQLVDTNLLVRFFTGEPAEMASKARRLVERADSGEMVLVVLPVIVAETFYTLESYYELARKDVAAKLIELLQSRGIEGVELPRMMNALAFCRDGNAHFADAYLAASALELNSPVASFDRDFDKFKGVQRIEPKG